MGFCGGRNRLIGLGGVWGMGDIGVGAGDIMGCVGVFVMVDGDCSCWRVCVLFPFPIV